MNHRPTPIPRQAKGTKALRLPRWTWWLLALAAALPLAVPGKASAQERAAAAAAPTAARERATATRAAAEPAAPVGAAAPAAPAAPADRTDRADLDRTRIIGNRELPKVLYIVPWKRPLHGNMGGRAVTGVVDEALAPIDRDVLRRQVSYDAQIRTAVAGAAPAAAAPAAPARTP